MRGMKSGSDHYLVVRVNRDGVATWNGISTWDGPRKAGSRLRNPMHRSTWLPEEKDARRWARRYRVAFVPAPAPVPPAEEK